MSKITTNIKFSKIEEEDDIDFLLKLHKHLSFKVEGAEFSPAFQNHYWDGREYLLNKKLEFYTGLLDIVKKFYSDNNKKIEIIDSEQSIVENKPLDITLALAKLGIKPYDYQLESVRQAAEHRRMIYHHATGSGKSLSIALLTAYFNKPTAIFVIGKELLYQFHELFSQIFDQEIGIIGDGNCIVKPISIVSVWSVGTALGLKKSEIFNSEETLDEKYDENSRESLIRFISSAKIIHFDECHISAAKTIRSIYKIINPENIYGWSGTPMRDSEEDLILTGIFGDYKYKVGASELIKRKILARPHIKFLYVKGSSHFTDPYTKVYNENIVDATHRNLVITNATKELIDKGFQVLVLFKQIKHGNILYKLFEQNGIKTEFLTGKDSKDKRAEVKENLLSKKSNCIIASMVYDIGVNIPTLTALVLAGSGKSSVKTLQRIGRVIRDGKNKEFVAVIDIWDDVRFLKKHSNIRKSLYETENEFEIYMPKGMKK